jgi:hypothetical protein
MHKAGDDSDGVSHISQIRAITAITLHFDKVVFRLILSEFLLQHGPEHTTHRPGKATHHHSFAAVGANIIYGTP